MGCGAPGPSTSLRGTHDRCFRSDDCSSSTTSRRLSRRPGAAGPGADGVGPGRDRHHPRHRDRHHRRRPARRHRHRHARRKPASPARYVTDANGEYTAPSIPTGTYTVTARAQRLQERDAGERPRRRRPARPRRRQARSRRDDRVGRDRRARRRSCRPRSSDLSTTVDEEQIKTLPLNGRNFVSLTRTIPGVLRGIPGSNIDGAGCLAWRASAAFSANGQRPRDNNYMLDGVDNNETWLQTVVIFPSVDALDEFKLQTSTYSAEFGRSLGGVVNLQIKSGANAFHGSAFEFLRNDAFDANNFFNNRAGRAEAGLQAAPVRRHARRPDLQGPDVLLRRLPGPAHQRRRRPTCRPCRRCGCATATSARSTASSTTR